MSSIIKLKPVFKERIWGGTRLRDYFGYDIPSENTGECWAISALSSGDCEIEDGEFKGKTLSWLYKNHRELFGGIENPEFPLLVKLIDAADNLSIQVHPDDKYAREVEKQQFGKTEAWYIIEADEDTVLEIGHNANSKEELHDMIENKKFQKLLNYKPIKAGDFFYIPSGTVHAICKDTLIYEIQQSSDITYRLYDYDRLDKKTDKPRELHTSKSIDVITVPQKIDTTAIPTVEADEGHQKIVYIENEYFSTYKYDVKDKVKLLNESFLLCTVMEGSGSIGDKEIKKGDNFIVPAECKDMLVVGNISIMISTM
ncbi:mannose-6-phosphate isomerase, class I [Clostridium omnivorum]|uniref:mannose-6-phosphate isomerase n=1 Tax=Clostridium omnivorum TaxID=1604902 RepID=A0ABQ5N7T2_9CLOT|nr:mannose-6-phosphate isomerase, class I [Clostridium sp. E14]GLC31235.1 putative mannose-6-phosphate isomerase YvyI [Clostridium sp. E14]